MTIESLKGKLVLVTGGAGFIGSHLVDRLLSVGARVRVLDNFFSGSRDNLAHCIDAIDLQEGDIRDPEACAKACAGASVVLHQAALGSVPRSMEDPGNTIGINVAGTTNVFAAARSEGIKRIVYASSSSVYGDSETLPKREGEEGKPLSPYALSKWMNEELAQNFAHCYGIDFVGLRYFNVFGPRQSPEGPYAAVIPCFFAACEAGKSPRIFGSGEQSRDFTFVGDVANANLLAATADVSGPNIINIGAGGSITVNKLAETIIKVTKADVAIEHLEPRAGDVMHSQADASAAARLIGFKAVVPLDEGLAAIANHRKR